MCGPDIPINIDKEKVLGRGGYALVLRGEMMKPVSVMDNDKKIGLHK